MTQGNTPLSENRDRNRDTAIRVEGVYKSFGAVKAVRDLSFSVKRSTCYALLGPNGAGKTTMMNMIFGRCLRDKPEDRPKGRPEDRPRDVSEGGKSGSIIDIFGYDPATHSLPIKYFSGVVPQETNLDVELNVTKNLLIYSKFYHLPVRTAGRRIDSLLDFMELSDKKTAGIRELSGGMKRRLLIARALLNEPRLLILDEPTTGLDPQVRHLIWDKLRQLKSEGTTILLTTHYMDEAFQLADTVLIMNQGRKLLEGNPQNLLEDNIETHVLEVRNPEQISFLGELIRLRQLRYDSYHHVMRVYSDDLEDLKRVSQRLNPRDYYHRQTNLEDLFLKLTGRELYEKQ
jgi:lipooligosaccharide transport system ATP-binding protein